MFGSDIAEPYTGHFGPAAEGAAGGRRLVAWLDRRLLGREPTTPEAAAIGPALEAWLGRVLAATEHPPLGLAVEGLPSGWVPVLQRAGLPLARGGSLHWGEELYAAPGAERPAIVDGRLRLPGPEWLAAASGIALRPVRRFVAQHFGIRLQAAPGVVMTLWPDQGLLVSTRKETLGGFLHGPRPGERQNLMWAPGQPLWVKW